MASTRRVPVLSTGLLCLATTLLFTLPLAAQQGGSNPVTETLQSSVKRYGGWLVQAAKDMPADKYSYKAVDGVRTFGEELEHVAGGNNMLCAGISGMKAPAMKDVATTDKDGLTAALQASFDFCQQALAKVSDSGLGEQVPWFGSRKVSRATAMVALAADWADHYGHIALYMRLNGLTPPSARRSGM
jgi:uncharacterized damage-inducible protein DinB